MASPNSHNADMAIDYKSQIALLDKAHLALTEYQIKGADEESTDLLRRLEDLRHRIHKKAGWHEVCRIVNGSATSGMFFGTLEQCKEYASIWKEGHPDDDIIIGPL